jgi:hypothetical protein
LKLFGFELIKAKDEQQLQIEVPSFAPREQDDGALVLAAGSTYGTYLDMEGAARTEAEIVARYREMAIQPEADRAINDIVEDAIVKEGNEKIVKIDLDDVEVPDNIKEQIRKEFENVMDLLDFNSAGYDIFKRWYIDGRIYYHIMIDINNPQLGIQELRYVDPRKIRKIRTMKKVKKDNLVLNIKGAEFYVYNEGGFKGSTASPTDNQGLQIAADSIIHVPSGMVDKDNKIVLGYLHTAIKPLNQLRMMEDSTVIYRISRAPERRVFNVDVGNLPKMKAEQYVYDMMVKHKNRLIYDASSGAIRDDRKFMTMVEDYWFPKRADGSGTKIETLPAGQNLGKMEDVEYFEKKLYEALKVPVSRLQGEGGFNLGRSSEISRDELRFEKFITRLRLKFSNIFLCALEKQLVLKKVISEEDWPNIRNRIHFEFQKDNYFAELKQEEILRERINTLGMLDPYVGNYFSKEWVQKEVLRLSDEDIAQMNEQIAQEASQQMAIGQDSESLEAVPGEEAAPDDQEQDQGYGETDPGDPKHPKSPRPQAGPPANKEPQIGDS